MYNQYQDLGVIKMDKPLGTITHYYNKIGVAIIDLAGPLSVGDKIKIVGHEHEFTQDVTSLQLQHKAIDKAKKGDDVGVKVDEPVKEKDQIFLVK